MNTVHFGNTRGFIAFTWFTLATTLPEASVELNRQAAALVLADWQKPGLNPPKRSIRVCFS
jgi:hypothetical protein